MSLCMGSHKTVVYYHYSSRTQRRSRNAAGSDPARTGSRIRRAPSRLPSYPDSTTLLLYKCKGTDRRTTMVAKPKKLPMEKGLSTQDWIDLAKETLITEGLPGVKVDRLAKKAGVTRGGFYYRFQSRQDRK